jgi:hypothetical protein
VTLAGARRLVLGIWVAAAAAMALQAWLTWGAGFAPRLAALAAPGPGSNPTLTAVAVALAWLILGITMILLTAPSVATERAVVILCYAGLALLYLNIMRERTYYGDFDNYFSAALNLRSGEPLPQRYLYPPLWASVLAPMTTFGEEWTLAFAWLMNLVSTLVCFVLLRRVLERYGFSPRLALAVTVAFGVVNVPILRTLSYAQINMHVLAGILCALYAYPRHRMVSAIALALAVHLKISPVVLALPFLWAWDVRWAAAFAVSLIGIAMIPAAAYGLDPYAQVLNNLAHIEQANGLTFRDSSIDSFVRATGRASEIDLELLIWPLKLALVVACLTVAAIHARARAFIGSHADATIVHSAMPGMLVLMVMASPLVWEHHPVFLALSYLAVATVLKPTDWPLFGLAYFLEFLMPTFDFFPWSYGRLLSPLLLLVLAWRRGADGHAPVFQAANRCLR